MADPKKATLNGDSIGRNVTAEMQGPVLVLRIDTEQSQGRSKSGKSEILGTTSGAARMADFVVNLNVYR